MSYIQITYPWTADDSTITADNPYIFADGGVLIGPPIVVMAVSAGTYAGLYYNPGDVFVITNQNDYSDSTKNQESYGGEWAPGWMLMQPASTPLYRAADNAPYPTYPAIDPNRRFVL